jgi:hypothetical protein
MNKHSKIPSFLGMTQMNEWMNKMNEWIKMNEWMNEWMNECNTHDIMYKINIQVYVFIKI